MSPTTFFATSLLCPLHRCPLFPLLLQVAKWSENNPRQARREGRRWHANGRARALCVSFPLRTQKAQAACHPTSAEGAPPGLHAQEGKCPSPWPHRTMPDRAPLSRISICMCKAGAGGKQGQQFCPSVRTTIPPSLRHHPHMPPPFDGWKDGTPLTLHRRTPTPTSPFPRKLGSAGGHVPPSRLSPPTLPTLSPHTPQGVG
ncbi:hypothetical protein EI94DRAFT_1704805 [Lactarius quietus]|nr:hypothetical protein EI94DRAFT_1704805 [Lactarius quietus]